MEKNNNKNNERRKRKMVENNNNNNNRGDEDVHQQEQEQDENEEEKMEQFFALIRNTKDMRDRIKQSGVIVGSSSSSKQHQNEKKSQPEEEDHVQKGSGFNNIINNNVGAQTWNPTFQVEDFLDDLAKSSINNINININIEQDATQELLPGSSSKSQETEVAEDKTEGGNNNDQLDLKLSL
ncbi:hypothetical protein Pint_21162 [Pistacia integerrima]|uniref:Uncharacterized protein n=1 Tax=Pistacia integerrima TaxID=434235 RepID=A0ACC0XF88_9ROSI|nr:hypothetical protein Pint_21162 [Pistacia integerrima]